MLSKVLSTMRNYMDTYDKAYEEFKTERARIDSNYLKGSQVYNEAFAAAQNKFQLIVQTNQQTTIEIMAKEFEDAHEELKAVVVGSISADTMNMIELVKQNVLSEFEFDAIMEKYGTSYLSARALADAYAHTTGKDCFIPAAEPYDERINELYNEVMKGIRTYGGNGVGDGFGAAILYNGDYINNLIEDVTKFINTYSAGKEK